MNANTTSMFAKVGYLLRPSNYGALSHLQEVRLGSLCSQIFSHKGASVSHNGGEIFLTAGSTFPEIYMLGRIELPKISPLHICDSTVYLQGQNLNPNHP